MEELMMKKINAEREIEKVEGEIKEKEVANRDIVVQVNQNLQLRTELKINIDKCETEKNINM
jgi:hypothetical protein